MPFEVSELLYSEVSGLADTFSLKFQSLHRFSEISELADAISLKFQSLPMSLLVLPFLHNFRAH